MFRPAIYIRRQSPSLTGYKLTHIRSPASITSFIPQHPPRKNFHSTPQLRCGKDKEIGTTGKMSNKVVTRSQSHLDAEKDTSQQKDESWKLRAPYQVQKDDEFGPVKWEAMCHCGRVQYQIKREKPLAAKYCHCRACQVIHGVFNPFYLYVSDFE